MLKGISRNDECIRRYVRIHTKISGAPKCPRLSVFHSNSSIYVQIIDGVNDVTLAPASGVELKLEDGGNIEAAKTVGTEITKRVIKKNIIGVIFGRGGYVYVGCVKALTEVARVINLEL